MVVVVGVVEIWEDVGNRVVVIVVVEEGIGIVEVKCQGIIVEEEVVVGVVMVVVAVIGKEVSFLLYVLLVL